MGQEEGNEWEQPDRGTALLTNSQREKLLSGELDRRDRRNIRDRVRDTMYDFILLNRHLRERDKLQILYPDAVEWQNRSDEVVLSQLEAELSNGGIYQEDLARGMVNMMRFFEDVALYSNAPGVGQIGDAVWDVDLVELMEEADDILEEKEADEIRLDDIGEMAEAVDRALQERVEGESEWEPVTTLTREEENKDR
jgi:hypothetical protein